MRALLAGRLSFGVLTTLLLVSTPASAATILVNGGFESGLSGWTTVDLFPPFGDGSFYSQSGALSPVNGLDVPAPPEGSYAAMSDAMGPGSHVLYQDVVIPTSIADATLSFSLFVQNLADDFHTPGTLDWSTPALNQQVRVDLLLPGIDPFTATVLLNLFQTQPGDPLSSGYTIYQFDVTSLLAAHAGQTLRLRFTDVNNVFIQNAGVDAVSLDVNSAPEPATIILLATAISASAIRRRRRR